MSQASHLYFNQDDWPDKVIEGRGLSVDVMALDEATGKEFKAWFNFNDMLWYSYEGKVAHRAFKWRYLYNFEK